MLHKADGPVLFDLGGFCSWSIRVFSGSLRIDCTAYFRDSVLSAVSGFAPRNCVLISARQSLCLLPRGFGSCAQSASSVLSERVKKQKKKGSRVHLVIIRGFRWRGCCLHQTVNSEELSWFLSRETNWTALIYALIAVAAVGYETAEVRFISSSG